MIAWILVGVLCVVAVVQRSLYKRACLDTFALTHLFQAVLLDESTYADQRGHFLRAVDDSNAASPEALSLESSTRLIEIGQGMGKNARFLLGVKDMLWAAKKGVRVA